MIRCPSFSPARPREAGGRIELSMPVERIEWHRGQVQVFARDGGDITQYTAEQAIIALPLGVLQDGSITFQPAPEPVIQAADLRMGPARRFTLLFASASGLSASPSICPSSVSCLRTMPCLRSGGPTIPSNPTP